MMTLNSVRYQISSDLSNIAGIVEGIIGFICMSADCSQEDTIFDVKVILNELIINAIKHGNKCDLNKRVVITAKMCRNGYACFTVEDEGTGFDFSVFNRNSDMRECMADLCDMGECGRGILIVKNLCKKVKFCNKGSRVVVYKKITGN